VPGAELRSGEIEQLPYANAAFDVVTGFNAFQYAADPIRALREARRVTAAGGAVVIVTWGQPEDCEATAYLKGAGVNAAAASPRSTRVRSRSGRRVRSRASPARPD
jgi:ubiquinone/menaquinone biosynthesis C-methylase UbiE